MLVLNYKIGITKLLRLERISSDHVIYLSCSKQSYVQIDFFYMYPKTETPQPLCSSVWPSPVRGVEYGDIFLCLNGFSYITICARCPFSLGTTEKELPMGFTFSDSSFLFINTRKSRVSLLVISSVTKVRELSLVNSKNILDHLCPPVLCLQQILPWLKLQCEQHGL